MTKREAGKRIDTLKATIDNLGTTALSVSRQIEAIGDKQLLHSAKIIIGISLALYGTVKKHELRLINKLTGKDRKTYGKAIKQEANANTAAYRRSVTGRRLGRNR